MDSDEFRRRGKEMVDYVADYLDNIRERRVYPTIKPGYLRELIPEEAPVEGENWDNVMADVERVIMPGITHWHHPNFHAYFPHANSFPSICGDILSAGIGCIGFSWASSPACTELEIVTMDWLGKMLKLPNEFLTSRSDGRGGGVIESTASESALMCALAARSKVINKKRDQDSSLSASDVIGRLVAYMSDQAHCSVERGMMIALVSYRKIESDDKHKMKPEALQAAIEEDLEGGKIPFFCCATLGTTSSCAFDNLIEIGPVCNRHGIWLHIDAAYAGAAFICPEFRHLLDGVEFADSFNFNPCKWMMVTFDCSALWVKESKSLSEIFKVDPLYLRHANQDRVFDYRHWGIPMGRRFRSLKLWFVLRCFGINQLQDRIRKDVALAQEFEEFVKKDNRFEIVNEVNMGLVCFRLKANNSINEELHRRINEEGRIHLVTSQIRDKYFMRFVVNSSRTLSKDVAFAWNVIAKTAAKILQSRCTRTSIL